MGAARLTQEQVAAVLRRAAELDGDPGDDDRLDVDAVEAAALDAGLSPAAVHHALAELRVGALEPEAARPMRVGLLGPSSLVVQRVVPGPLPSVERAVASWLSGQLFERCRHLGDRALWARREGAVASVRRALDLNSRLALNGIRSIEVAMTDPPAGQGQVLVRLRADVGDQRTAHAWCFVGGAVVGTVAGGLGGMILVDPPVLALVASLPLGAGGALTGHQTGRAHYRREVAKVETALAGLLDRVERRPSWPTEAARTTEPTS